MRIVTVFGTRPEAIKMAPVVRALAADPSIEQTVVVTAQHRQMLDQVLDLFEIVPDVDLDLMREQQSLEGLTGRVIEAMTPLLRDLAPDRVLVHGDTTTAMASALAAYYARVESGHVEAGLRTHNPWAPWPEEMNRQLIGRMATLHFAPTSRARDHLLAEGVAQDTVEVTGNTVIDALHFVSGRLRAAELEGSLTLATLLEGNAAHQRMSPAHLDLLSSVRAGERRLVLITGHRRENFGGGFMNICDAVSALARRYPDVVFVYPVHLNPQVRGPVHERLSALNNVLLLPPLDYAPFVYLMEMSTLVLTDSGGIQEEAPGLGKPVLVMRETTERPEAVEAGTVRLVGADASRIQEGVSALLEDEALYAAMAGAHNPYGDGRASERIVARLRAGVAP